MLSNVLTKLLKVFVFIVLIIIVIQFYYINKNKMEFSLKNYWHLSVTITVIFISGLMFLIVDRIRRIGARIRIATNQFTVKKGLFLILLLAFIVRLLWILLIPTIPASDFGLMYKYAQSVQQGNFSGFHNYEYFARFAHDTVTVLYFSLFYNLTGNPLFIIKLFNVLFSTLAVFYMFKIVRQLYSEFHGLLAALMLAVFPPFIMYNSQTMSENLAMPFFLISVYYFVLLSINEQVSYWDKSKYLLFCGLGLCIGNLFRTVGSIFLLSYIIYFLVYKGFKKSALSMPVLIAGYLIPMYLLSSLFIMNGITETHLWKDKEPSWTSVLRGTNFKYQGRWNPEDAKIPEIYNNDPGKVAQASKQIIKDRLSNASFPQITSLLLAKIGIEWAVPDMGAYAWTIPPPSESDGQFLKIVRNCEPVIMLTSALFYFSLLLFGMFSLIRIKNRPAETNFFLLLFSGFVMLLLITEAQPRYAFIISWIFIIFAIGGLKGIDNPDFKLQ